MAGILDLLFSGQPIGQQQVPMQGTPWQASDQPPQLPAGLLAQMLQANQRPQVDPVPSRPMPQDLPPLPAPVEIPSTKVAALAPADQPMLPPTAQTMQGGMPPGIQMPSGHELPFGLGAQQPINPLGSITKGTPFQPVSDWIGQNKSTLLGLAAGLAGAPSFGEGMARGFRGAAAGSQMDQHNVQTGQAQQMQNATARYLLSKGLTPDQTMAMLSNPAALGAFLKQASGAGGGEYGLSPVWGTDANGNPAIMQLGKDGKPVQTPLPQGFNIARDPIKVDAGTHFVLLDPQTRQPVATVPKDVAGEAKQGIVGKAQGEAEVALPDTLAKSQNVLSTIADVRNDPYLSRGTGWTSVFNAIPGTGGYDFSQKVAQLKGQTFLEAFNSLRGAGAISEVEGAKATDAIGRLGTAQSEQAFRKALDDLEGVVRAGAERAKGKAGVGGSPNAPAAVPAAPAIRRYNPATGAIE
ncbi:hypothetical protein [Xanthobacter versatilis]|uniref:hypothetical protein n=1 Tax=Xanthobacter autotrophicus (strain ATCC BAA-1158 / Py2) TaxID=78245 RepID=UPI00372BB6D3